MFVLLGAGLLRLWRLDRQPLWLDEAFTASWVASGWRNCILADPFHPPLYHAATKLFVSVFGLSEYTLRFLPAVFGALTVWATWLLLRRLSPQAARTALVLTAGSPFLIYYSQEARDYELLIFLSVLSTWSFVRFRQDGRGLALYAGLSICLMYSHLCGAMVLLSHEIVFWLYGRARWREWLIARLAVFLAFLPWAGWSFRELLGHVQSTASHRPRYALLKPAQAWVRLLLGYGIAVSDVERRQQSLWRVLREESPVLIPALALFGWLFVRGASRLRGNRESRSFFACVLLLPVAVVLAVGAGPERYLAFQAPFLLAVVAIGHSSLRPLARALSACACAAIFTLALLAYYAAPGSAFGYPFRFAKEDWPAAAAFVRSMNPDTIVLAPGYIADSFNWYWRSGSSRNVVELPESGVIPNLRSARRVALVVSHTAGEEQALLAHFDASYRRVAERLFPAQMGIWVYVYDARVAGNEPPKALRAP
jgi:mannosyltransferase